MLATANSPISELSPEDELLKCLQENGQRFFSKLYERFSPALFGIIQGWIKDREVAENLLQDVFIKAWRYKSSYDQAKGRLFTWLYRIARHSCIDHLRSKACKKTRVSVFSDDISRLALRVTTDNVQPDTIGLRKLVTALRQEEKEVIELTYFKGCTQREIAAIMNIPLGTVKTRMSKGIRDLRYYFNKDWKDAKRMISLN